MDLRSTWLKLDTAVNDGEPDFLVTYFMGIKEKYDIRYIDYGFPGRWGTWGPWGRW